ncbi:DNA-binding protein Tfx [Methanothermobacter wolfeii]|uniref:DNA-binding protein Tfx n=3 Tax=Methanothermobacter TaxID=145260 RepID=TFX_METTM|nr:MULTISPECIES: DNA-binding protein Tfx [Methanothermobacter]P56811.2 RecName: Full=DNA-binding protein Tfx [Methanothermobacter marburgensis str. Marburg]MDI6818743.1 DNA-binding protein Tfx [Methanothermobacter thermautotrophicus]NLM01873.1 Tfx family DNA-binding protein [Methanothermobacter wolfeii]QEF94921.1 Tfx family DNA-binding protein [Methanothermobacter sp. KEPCO-1]QHN06671.1 Tfx family DNA-binding protein [Methanothermobacter sp. THM-1]QHN08046.1 Tfx family DNA-binding protein [Me
MSKKTFLTERQKTVLEMRERGWSQKKIARELKTTRQNVSAIERKAMENIEKSRNTLDFVKFLKSPVRILCRRGDTLDEIIKRLLEESNKEGIHVIHDSITLAFLIREKASHRIVHRVVKSDFEIGVTRDGEIIVDLNS